MLPHTRFTLLKAYTNLGQRVYLDFTHELSINTLGHEKEHECNPNWNRNYDSICYNSLARENKNVLGCSVPFHPPLSSDLQQHDADICANLTSGKKAMDNYDAMRDSNLADDGSADQTSCAWFDIFLGLPFIDDEGNDANEAYIRLYIKSKIKVKSIVRYYDSTTLAAEIGGYVGMFVGVSMVDLAILFNAGFMKMAGRKF